jgi:hypothetical protein
MTRVRWRIDRVGVEALCEAWWLGEHGAKVALAWASVDGDARDEVVARVKWLIKGGVIQTPGDAVAAAELRAADEASAKRAVDAVAAREVLAVEARRRAAVLSRTHTARVLEWLSTSRVNGSVSVDQDGRGHPGVLEGMLVWTADELKAVLKQLEHLPSRTELTKKRLDTAERRKQSERRPRPPRR